MNAPRSAPVIDDAGKGGQFSNHGFRSDFRDSQVPVLGNLGRRQRRNVVFWAFDGLL